MDGTSGLVGWWFSVAVGVSQVDLGVDCLVENQEKMPWVDILMWVGDKMESGWKEILERVGEGRCRQKGKGGTR